MPETQIPEIAKRDLEDPVLFRLNNMFRFLAQEIAKVQGILGEYRFRSGIAAPEATLSGDLSVSGQTNLFLREFASNAAALAGGLVPGNLYRNAAGDVKVVM